MLNGPTPVPPPMEPSAIEQVPAPELPSVIEDGTPDSGLTPPSVPAPRSGNRPVPKDNRLTAQPASPAIREPRQPAKRCSTYGPTCRITGCEAGRFQVHRWPNRGFDVGHRTLIVERNRHHEIQKRHCIQPRLRSRCIDYGCASMTHKQDGKRTKFGKVLPWAKDRAPDPYPNPARMATTWTPDTLLQSGRTPTRGFGGRLFFYDDKTHAVPVEGELTVHAFSEPTDGSKGEVKRYVFTAEQFTSHFSQTISVPLIAFGFHGMLWAVNKRESH